MSSCYHLQDHINNKKHRDDRKRNLSDTFLWANSKVFKIVRAW